METDRVERSSADQAFKAAPYPLYATLRASEPIARVTLNGMDGWFVTSYDLVRRRQAEQQPGQRRR